MIIVMQRQATATQINNVITFIRQRGLHEHISHGEERTIIGAVGDERVFEPRELEALAGVEKALRILQDWRIISRETQPQDTIITVRGQQFGGQHCHRVASTTGLQLPENNNIFIDPFYQTASPYTPPQQTGTNVLQQITQAHQANKSVWLRIRDVRQLEPALQAEADIIYLGGELMSNRTLLNEVGCLNIPVVLCKDKHHQVDDWLIAAEHIALKGNHHLMLGEAGTLSLERNAPYRLDVEAIVKARQITHLPIVANISHLAHAYMNSATLMQLAQAAGAHIIIY
ncbi:chorismate mutase [Snodgrassella sp. ESL0253]|uniref:chorismate mutase n=1 Tax=Snodgrassella sp. ESL0253 TaxID=2705031 RepID=UPI001583CB92|nr:chorismate mutase [Snodgrassella sp. ESL0253]NUE67036.1 chorismate mutase [Snodgrassella sp. ESL0253]